MTTFEPNYGGNCEVCDQSPTILIFEDGVPIEEVHLCGPCCWGEAKAIDPDTW